MSSTKHHPKNHGGSCWRRLCKRRAGFTKNKEILVLGEGADLDRVNNKVVTAKYSLLTFLPYSFVNQFRHFTNAYFLIIFIIAVLGDSTISSLNWFQSPYDATGFILSLSVVVGISMGFDLAYDVGRHIQDRKVNRRTARRINENGEEERITWQELLPGDMIVVERDCRFPADLLFLEARPSPLSQDQSDFDNTKCYVETSNIDGETNLKVRFVPNIPFQVKSSSWWDKLADWTISYDLPKPALEFSGVMMYSGQRTVDDASDDPEQFSPPKDVALDFSNLLLRDSVLKNTHEIIGVVVYAGRETKGVQSSSATKSKISNAMKLVNRAILVILFVGLIMVLVSAGIASTRSQDLWYLKNPPPYVFGPFWSAFFTFIILYSNLLPISLVIATTITNFIQAQFVNWDVEMYDETKDRAAKCATLELAQEIGQVSFLFSDKTGTLTRNEMKFVGCTTGLDRSFGLGETTYETEASDKPLEDIFSEFLRLVQSNHAGAQRENARMFLALLSVCHTVLVEGSGDKIKYNAEGPDEEALVAGAAKLGFVLTRNVRTVIEVESDVMAQAYSSGGRVHRFELIGINHFDSTRKRMSVVVRLPNNSLELMVKGADSVMFERLSKEVSQEEERMRARIGEHLDRFAANGLRTLVVGRRRLGEDEVSAYTAAIEHANAQLGEEKHRLIAEAADTLEKDLTVIGASAIEDRLQDGVPETLKCLRNAGIKTWVLTGDKVETAINIGYSSGVLTNEMQLIQITSSDKSANMAALESLEKAMDPKSLQELNKQLRRASRRKLFSPTRRTRGVSLGTDGVTGEDPFGMGSLTKEVVGGIVENGFHAFTSAYAGGRRALKSGVRRHGRAPSKDAADIQNRTSVTRASETNGTTATFKTPSNSFTGDIGEKFTFAPGVDANTSFEGASNEEDLHGGGGLESSFVEASSIQQIPLIVRQTSTVIPADANYEASLLALVVSGAALNGILHDPKLKNPRASDDPTAPITDEELKFLSLAKVCKVVIACRVSPRQKALLVRLVRKGVKIGGKEPVTLAIGDGQNDVAMIQESRVGVGIAGREGSQAVNAADFSIGQFRFLRRLLLVHGRWNYRRMAFLVLYIFYAHIMPVLAAFAYNFIDDWSGTTPFPFTWVIAYSYIVVIPGIFLAAFNRDISARTAFQYPSIYISGRANLHMGRFKVIEYVFKAISHGTIVCGFIYGAFAMPSMSYLDLGTLVYWCILLVVLSRLALECYTWTVISAIVYLICLIIFPILEVIIYGSDITINTLWGTTVLFGPLAKYIWAVVFFIIVTAILFDVSLSYGRRVFFPNLIDIVIEIDRGYAPDGASAMDDANAALNMLSRPQELPREAVSAALGGAESVPFAPRYRSAYAQDVPEGQTVEGPQRRNRFARFSLKPGSFTLGKRTEKRASATTQPPPPEEVPVVVIEQASGSPQLSREISKS